MAERAARSGQTAFVVLVPEAEPRIGAVRERFDPALHLGVPAHLTLLHPFLPPQRVHRGVLRRAAAALARVRPFAFRLAAVGRFPGSVHLIPDPAEPFAAMTDALGRAFPDFPPYGGVHATIVPHLTVGASDDGVDLDAAEAQARAVLASGPIDAACRHVALLGRQAGRWRTLHLLPL